MFEQAFYKRQIRRHGHLGIRRLAGNQPDRLADQFACRRVVRQNQVLLPGGGDGAPDDLHTRNVCGVCTDHNLERSTVREIVFPSMVSLMVSVTGWAATAAPVSRAAATVAPIKSAVVQGRAASWMATISVPAERASSPFQTESCRSAPRQPAGNFFGNGTVPRVF